MEKLRIAALQLEVIWQNAEANRNRIETLFSTFEPSVDLILLPEMFSTGFTMEAKNLAEEMDGPTVTWMKSFAQSQNSLVGGSLIIKEGDHFRNRFILVNGNEILATYDKRHLFRISGEHKTYRPGEEQGFFEVMGWKVAIQICYDLRFPVWARNRKNEDGFEFDLMINVASWPEVRISHWDTLLNARAIENQAYVVGLNRVGEDGNGMAHPGSSVILDPLGEPLAYNYEDEVILHAVLDYDKMKKYREKFPIWKDSDIFKME